MGAGLCISVIVCLCVRRLAVITHSRRLAQASGAASPHSRLTLWLHDLLRSDLPLWRSVYYCALHSLFPTLPASKAWLCTWL